ncbi:MAG: SUMF1/EgtB/PvdO family nonheme iron enzyme [Myxococcales bacterium]|nr:SUMF1/EgtB/PvdO family nonheme iron enzyme [Myxococcales bacterium]
MSRSRIRAVLGLAVLCVLAVAAGCNTDPLQVPLGEGGALRDGAADSDADGAGSDADGRVPGDGPGEGPPDLSYDACRAQVELCNNVDDNCDNVIDEGFDKQGDVRYCENCKGCAALINMNAIPTCQAGKCVISSCAGGYVDLNKDPKDGCEYQCTATGLEICDGVDNDCNGQVDDGLTTPQNTCKQLGACAGSKPVCRGKDGWLCDYSADVELQPCQTQADCGAGIPCVSNTCLGQVAGQETRCDGKDNDCDDVADDPWKGSSAPQQLGADCTPDASKLGICRDQGVIACNAAGDGVECKITTPGQPKKNQELCNGLDDDCDGKVDETTDDAAGLGVVDATVRVQRTVGGTAYNFEIYAYEASRPDASSSSSGTQEARACSKPGVLPWGGVTYASALKACQAAGMRLCTAAEWLVACQSAAATLYPYGASYNASSCNGLENNNGAPLPTGNKAACESGSEGLFDMSGNLREWTSTKTGQTSTGKDIYLVRGGAYNTPAPGLTCPFNLTQAVDEVVLPANGFRCCK